jgi:type VI secretion system secreted protein Hcp
MTTPAYMWLKDDGGVDIKGSSTVQGREGSIEIIGFSHGVNLPVDSNSGKITGTRAHSAMSLEKEFDASTPYLYKAAAKGQTLKSAELRWYRINNAGQEEAYFTMLLEGVKVTGVDPGMPDTPTVEISEINHIESVSVMYERITWHYAGNIKFTDDWNKPFATLFRL